MRSVVAGSFYQGPAFPRQARQCARHVARQAKTRSIHGLTGRTGGKQIQAQLFRQKLRHQLPLNAGARLIERRGKGGQAALAGGNRQQTTADAAFAGQPRFVEQSPEFSYSPAVTMTASTCSQWIGSMMASWVMGLTPPLAKVAAITARSRAVTLRQHCLV